MFANARILRLHTPVDVDYSNTATLLQSVPDGPLRVLTSVLGMAQPTAPDAAESIGALKFLLQGRKLPSSPETVKTISDVYWFLPDGERDDQFHFDVVRQEQRLAERVPETRVTMAGRGATVSVPKRM